MRQREPKLSQWKKRKLLLKIPPLKRPADGGLQETSPPSSHVHRNPEERYPVLKDPTLVRVGRQLACLDLLTTLPPQNKTEYSVKIYSLIECKSGAIIGDGDRKSWDPRAPMIWDNFSILRAH